MAKFELVTQLTALHTVLAPSGNTYQSLKGKAFIVKDPRDIAYFTSKPKRFHRVTLFSGVQNKYVPEEEELFKVLTEEAKVPKEYAEEVVRRLSFASNLVYALEHNTVPEELHGEELEMVRAHYFPKEEVKEEEDTGETVVADSDDKDEDYDNAELTLNYDKMKKGEIIALLTKNQDEAVELMKKTKTELVDLAQSKTTEASKEEEKPSLPSDSDDEDEEGDEDEEDKE